ncbi:cytochrome P450 [Mycena rebaudengoi]|nr:cytochrome P450 [Mycena rebaudengoi]
MSPIVAFLAAVSVGVACILLLTRRQRGRLPLPPGPPTRFFMGNVLQMPSSAAWYRVTEWKQEYGDLVYLHGLGNSMLVVNSLASKRWSIYSHRHIFTAAGELMGVDQNMALLSYGDEWREQRKIVNSSINPTATKQWRGIQQDLAALMTKSLLDSPQNFMAHIRLTASRIVLQVGFGLFALDMEDPYIKDNEKAMAILGEAMSPGSFLCDLFPILKHSPSWIPFQRRIAESRKVIYRTVYEPYEDVKNLVSQDLAPLSLARDVITSLNNDPKAEKRAPWALASIYGAGTETTAATVQTFVLAMALNPQTAIIGLDRMPIIEDMSQLPFIQAVIKETLRWHPPVPLSIPRRTAKDDDYAGFFIPKNTTVFPNIWAIARDTSNPDDFNPDRFLDESDQPPNPFDYVFGTGRRICVGIHLAENSLFALISAILWAFDIAPPAGEKLTARFNGKHISSPEPFHCTITPRSEAKARLVIHTQKMLRRELRSAETLRFYFCHEFNL